MVHLEELNKYNVWDVIELTVKKEQESFIAGNEWSLVHAYVGNKTEGAVYPFGIFDDDKAVGFLMIAYDYGEVCNDPDAPEISQKNYFLWRLMIDEEEQGKGYGKKAVKLALEFVKTFPHGKADYCWLCYDKNNEVARKLYLSMGFQEIGEQDDDINAVIKL
ncbi:MAG: GNAT family N-acetyltransferase [Oscillospiraceae bacterium]|jgi:diamine N-acetyltransferase|nr:GNAT family N-acetyltransferase [Oscillospiraceae bacterium]